MNPEPQLLVIMTTVPDQTIALSLAHNLVSEQLAGCVQVLPPITSVYVWQGKICQEPEHLLLIKTLPHLYDQVEAYILDHHPYQEPEIIGLPVTQASSGYRQWLSLSVQPN